MGRALLALAATAACVLGFASTPAEGALPPVKHVFIIVLENENAASTFGPNSKAPYLARTLPTQGQFAPNFYAVTHQSLGNYVALVSAQGSNPQTQSDCQIYTEFALVTFGADGQAHGDGCVYPTTVKTVADQLAAKGMTWKGYMEDMGNTPGQSATCRHPAIGARDDTQSAKKGDQYAARHNPFVYFHSIIDSPLCAQNNVPLDRLPADLRSASTTANYVFITPNLCNDGHDEPCVDGQPGGLVSADAFLKRWVPQIEGSAAYRQGGLIVVTFDEAEAGPGGDADSSECCSQPQFPNTLNNGGPTPGQGGGRVGAVFLSPFVKPASRTDTRYNHFSLLRSVEDLFQLGHLGYAARSDLAAFGSDVYNAGPPKLDDLAVRPARLRTARASARRGATISYTVSQPARVSFRVERVLSGRRSRGRCRRPSRRNRRGRRCARYRHLRGGFEQNAVLGSNSLSFSGRLDGRRLKAARYRLVAVPSGFAGEGSRATRRFRVAGARRKQARRRARVRRRSTSPRTIELAG